VKEPATDFVAVLSTGQLMKFDMAVNILKDAGIAHQVRAETSTGLKIAMPVVAGPGLGQFFTILVPANAEAQAKQVLAELPFEIATNPGAWDFAPQPTVQRWWKVSIIVVLTCLIAYWLIEILGSAR
jgi:hypothetical protein